jgi:hypothetical protein
MHPRRGRSVSATLLIRILGSLLALGVAIVLPSLRTHHFGQLYKPIEFRQTTVRHSFLDFEDSGNEVQLDAAATNPLPVQLAVEDGSHSAALRAVAARTAAVRTPIFIFRHLRAGGSRSSPPDPLIA